MARYVSLLRFTPQGAKNLKQSPARAAAFRKAAEKAGVNVEAQLWTVGAYDGILILNAADEQRALKAVARLAVAGHVTTQHSGRWTRKHSQPSLRSNSPAKNSQSFSSRSGSRPGRTDF